MRYNVHPHPRATRYTVARLIGVFACSALVAVLGLPTAAQGQVLAPVSESPARGVTFADDGGFTIDWTANPRFDSSGINNWLVTVTDPSGRATVVTEQSTTADTLGAVETTEAATLGDNSTRDLMYNKRDEGTWWVQVSACFAELTTRGTCAGASTEAGGSVGYTHGSPAAPMNFAASMVPNGVFLTWDALDKDQGISVYQYAYELGSDGDPDWQDQNGGSGTGTQLIDADDLEPGEHMFYVRAIGVSDNSTSTDEGDDVPGEAAMLGMMMPMPTPTLSEWGAISLGMLLMTGGVYYTRRRQNVPLLTA